MKNLIVIMTVIISFTVLSCAKQSTSLSINDSKWTLSEWPEKNIPDAAKATLNFAGDGRVSGKAFCNNFGGDAIISGNNIKFDKMFSTKMYCQDLAESEDVYLADLGKVSKGEIKDGKLYLYQGKDLLMIFTKSK